MSFVCFCVSGGSFAEQTDGTESRELEQHAAQLLSVLHRGKTLSKVALALFPLPSLTRHLALSVGADGGHRLPSSVVGSSRISGVGSVTSAMSHKKL